MCLEQEGITAVHHCASSDGAADARLLPVSSDPARLQPTEADQSRGPPDIVRLEQLRVEVHHILL